MTTNKNLIVLTTAMMLSALVQSQTIAVTGKVTDALSGQALVGASVFCQNTTYGTTSGAEGIFSMTLAEGGYDLVVSYSGYETFSIQIGKGSSKNETFDIRLKVKDRSLEEVSVIATNEVREGWKKYGSLFRDHFLGMTEDVDSCIIQNSDSLRFFYSRKKDRLKVTAREPLRIENKILGYRIRYELDSFIYEFGSGNTEYIGFALFEEMEGSESQLASWKERRERAYFGSMFHFMRCYYDSTLRLNGYRIERIDPRSGQSQLVYNPYDSSFFEAFDDGEAMLVSNGRLRVTYTDEKPENRYLKVKGLSAETTVQISVLDFPESIMIEQNGYFYDQKHIFALGYWSWEKLAMLLPYDYDPDR